MQTAPVPSTALKLAAVYNLAFGLITLLFPEASLAWAGMEAPRYPVIWQCLGMVIGVYGVGYWIAAKDPNRHWPIVLVGLLGKIFGPVGFIWYAYQGLIPWALGAMIITNDLIWWLPFGRLLWNALSAEQENKSPERWPSLDAALPELSTSSGQSLLALSAEKPCLLVFLRHLGCTFCTETLQILGALPCKEREQMQLVIVSMGPQTLLDEKLKTHGLQDAARIIDPDQHVYRAFGLGRGSFGQLFGLPSLIGGLRAYFTKGIGVGPLAGDGFRMPGYSVLYQGKLLASEPAKNAADIPDYSALLKRDWTR